MDQQLIYEDTFRMSFLQRLVFIIFGEFKVRLWQSQDLQILRVECKSRKLNGKWE